MKGSGEPRGDLQEVVLYFWDRHDDADFLGWWFGCSVGGVEVFAQAKKADMTPPRSGYLMWPWNCEMLPLTVAKASVKR